MTDTIRLAGAIQTDSIVNGEGLRSVIWFQGCPHHCPGCHNPSSQNFNGGEVVKLSSVIDEISNLKHQDGITLSGGEPFFQPQALLVIAKYAKSLKLNVWCYTGYLYEELLKMSEKDNLYLEILKEIDVLVDGKFLKEEKSLNLKFKGSKNQRIIDVHKSIKKNEVILIPKYKKEKKVLVTAS